MLNVELILNFLQLLVALGSGLYVGILFKKSKMKHHFLGMGFLLTLSLGSLYWFSYQMLMNETPQYFYISDIAWITSYLFLGALGLYICEEKEKEYHHLISYVPFIIGASLFVYFIQWGDVLVNFLYIAPLALCAHQAMKSLLYHYHMKKESKYRKIHIFIIVFAATEYALWLSSCFWISDTWTNPYFWFDMALTLEFIAFAYLMKEVSEDD